MEVSEDGLREFLRRKTQAHWDENKQPYYLSRVAIDLREEGVDYRDILKDEKLKEFGRRALATAGFKLVEHPTQKAKVGLVPSDVPFEFPIESMEAPPETGRSARAEGQVLLDFLHALSKLPSADLDGVVIPARVLVKLAGKK